MIILRVFLIIFIISSSMQLKADDIDLYKKAQDTALNIKSAIIENDWRKFHQLHGVSDHIDPAYLAQDQDYQTYIMDAQEGIRHFLINSITHTHIEILLYEDGTYKAKIWYFIPDKFDAAKPYNLDNPADTELLYSEWKKSYVQTELLYYQGQWIINSPAFYFGWHAPWAGEYGR